MNGRCESLRRIVNDLPLVQECDEVSNGALRMSTPFLYPNGEHVDVFLESSSPLLQHYALSDFGQTGLFLRDSHIQYGVTAKKRQVLEDVLHQCGVSLKQGDLRIELLDDDLRDISDAIFRLARACTRIADFYLHQRLRSANPFKDDVEEFFEASKLLYIPDARVMGKFKKEIKLDFSVFSGALVSHVLVLASMNESSAHSSANEIFRKWYDLEGSTNLVTIYNSASPAIRPEDIARLRERSSVISYPEEQDFLASTLTGAMA